jgi:hypothetical protein
VKRVTDCRTVADGVESWGRRREALDAKEVCWRAILRNQCMNESLGHIHWCPPSFVSCQLKVVNFLELGDFLHRSGSAFPRHASLATLPNGASRIKDPFFPGEPPSCTLLAHLAVLQLWTLFVSQTAILCHSVNLLQTSLRLSNGYKRYECLSASGVSPKPCRFRQHYVSDWAEIVETRFPVQCHVCWYVLLNRMR